MTRTHSLVFTLCFLSACSSSDPDPAPAGDGSAPPPLPFPASWGADFSATLDGVVAAGVAPGVSIAVERPGYEPWSGAAGVADVATGEPLTTARAFRAGSMLKMPIAASVMQLVEQGRLSLDSTLPELLPVAITTRVPDAAAITVRMLLAHTSGLPEYADDEYDRAVLEDPRHVWTLDEVLARAFDQPPSFPPGAGWSYANTNYILLGEILSELSGRPWRESIRAGIFGRAELGHSWLPEEGDASCSVCSRGYELVDGRLVDVTEVDPSMAGAAGGDALVTTPADLVRFLGALASGQLFDEPTTFAQMLELTPAPIPEETQTDYGLGVARFELGDTELVGHLGGTAGFQGFAFLQPASGLRVSGYMNQRGDLGGFVLPVLQAVERMR